MKLIITTVGTSIFTNYKTDEVKAKLGRDYAPINVPYERTNLLGDKSEVPAAGIYEDTYKPYINSLKEIIKDFWFEYPAIGQPNEKLSSEISSILNIVRHETEPIKIHLVASDTLQSVLAAELIAEWIKTYKNRYPKLGMVVFERQSTIFNEQKDSNYVVKDLRVRSQSDYQAGFMNLIALLNKIQQPNKTVLNITGGYKGVVPVLTLFGQIKNIPLNYLFREETDATQKANIVIGNLPINFDFSYIEGYMECLVNDKILSGEVEGNNAGKLKKMYELGLLNNEAAPTGLSIVGELIKAELESAELPFLKTTLGYLVEHKLFEYYSKNRIEGFAEPKLGFPLSDKPEEDMEDADLWFENETEIIVGEVKPQSISPKSMIDKVAKILGFVSQFYTKKVREFWVILYFFKSDFKTQDWALKTFTPEFLAAYPGIKFRVKIFHLKSNLIDGNRNRFRYHEFIRSKLDVGDIQDVFES